MKAALSLSNWIYVSSKLENVEDTSEVHSSTESEEIELA